MMKIYTILVFTLTLLISEKLIAKNLSANGLEDPIQMSQFMTDKSGTTSNLDVIIVFDNSDSMSFYESTLEFYVNSYFYQILDPVSFDTRVILISDDTTDNEGICLPSPLGSGSCPNDENLPKYQHVIQNVSDTNALSTIVSTYDLWDQTLRPNSKRAVIVISNGHADMTADAFISALISLDNDFTGFQFHAIALTPTDGCSNPIDNSTVYKQLTDLTNGLLHYFYLEFFVAAWNNKAQHIIDSIFHSEFECIGH